MIPMFILLPFVVMSVPQALGEVSPPAHTHTHTRSHTHLCVQTDRDTEAGGSVGPQASELGFLQINTQVVQLQHGQVVQLHNSRSSGMPSVAEWVTIPTVYGISCLVPAVVLLLFFASVLMPVRKSCQTPHLIALEQQASHGTGTVLDGKTFVEMLYARATSLSKTSTAIRAWSEVGGIETSISYEQLARWVHGSSEVMAEMGVRPGHRVAFYSKGTLDFFVAFLSVQSAGATPVLLNWRQSKENLKGMIEDSGSTFLILGALNDTREELMSVLPENIEALLLLDGKTPSGFRGTVHNWALREADIDFQSIPVSKVIDRSSEAAIFFTSGSTSRPKPVLHTYSSLIWTAENFVFPVNITATLSFLPNFHVIMTLQNFLIPLARGICISVHAADATMPITAGMLLKAAAELSPSVIDTVPFIMEEWSALSYEELKPLRQCALVQSGGAPLSTAIASALLDAGVPVRQHYGQTEAPGIQLATVPGATASEISIFMPPWKMASAVLDGGREEGELLIQGIENTALGNLAAGVLVPGSCKMEEGVGHRTGDVFRWMKTESGQVGLQHCMRVDDTILLSTGEMFNPVPMEKNISSHLHGEGLQGALVAVLGKNRPSPILVVELPGGQVMETQAALHKLRPGIDAANASEVEYARIKPNYVLILGTSDKDSLLMPKTAKGNFIRSQSEDILRKVLDEVEDYAREAQARDLLEKARAAGYNDVKELLESSEDKLVDSLGAELKKDSNMSDFVAICDNIKAIGIVTVLIYHFYFLSAKPSHLSAMGQNLLFAASGADVADHNFDKVITGLYGFTLSMWCFFFAFGTMDGIRDGSGREVVFFSGHTFATVLIMLLYKLTRCFLLLFTYLGYLVDGNAGLVVKSEWFLYVILYYRASVKLMQLLRVPIWLQVTLATILALNGLFFGGGQTAIYGFPEYLWPVYALMSWKTGLIPCPFFYNMAEVLSPGNNFKTSIPGVCISEFSSTLSLWTPVWDIFGLIHVLSFYWGEAALVWMLAQRQKILVFIKGNCSGYCSEYNVRLATSICSVVATYGLFILIPSDLSTWTLLQVVSTQWMIVWVGFFFILLAAVSCPVHMKRIGANSLGIYICHRYSLFFMCGFVVDICNIIGERLGLESIASTTIQLLLLMAWPVLLSYVCGPFFQSLVIVPVTYIREKFSLDE